MATASETEPAGGATFSARRSAANSITPDPATPKAVQKALEMRGMKRGDWRVDGIGKQEQRKNLPEGYRNLGLESGDVGNPGLARFPAGH